MAGEVVRSPDATEVDVDDSVLIAKVAFALGGRDACLGSDTRSRILGAVLVLEKKRQLSLSDGRILALPDCLLRMR